ncbi:MAG TPA: alpha/beta hydrolase [Longimicrobiaceae bacterium]|nr:alpha/beta hydrolase [Longimicrobiaceae bacterium]
MGRLRLRYQAWESDTARSAVLISHGLGEHSARYSAFAELLASCHVNVYALDHRGHGRSDGRRGHVDSFQQYLEDFERFRRTILSSLPSGIPLFLLGHSLGGLIAIRYLQEFSTHYFAGAILSAPALGISADVPPWKNALAGFLSYVLPAFPLSNELDPADLSHDPAVVAAYLADPLVHDRITPRLFVEMNKAIQDAFDQRAKLDIPLLLLLPAEDRIADSEATLRFAGGIPERVSTHVYPDTGHEVLNGGSRAAAIDAILAWMAARMA